MTGEAEIRRIACEDTIPVSVLRDFVLAALRHDAISDALTELLFNRVSKGDFRPEPLAPSLRSMIEEILDAAEPEDWQIVALRLIDDAREAVEVRCPE